MSPRLRDQHASLPITINRFDIGLVSNRDPLHAPVAYNGAGPYVAGDALIDGLNVEISNNNTIVRRPGFPTYCSSAIPSGTPLAFAQKRAGGATVLFLDTTTDVFKFTSSAITSIYTKGTTAQSYFQQAGSHYFWADGTNARRLIDNTSTYKWGIAAPDTAPNTANIAASGFNSWAANTFYNASLLIYDSNGNLQKLTTSGTTNGAAEPTWSLVTGNTTADGTAVWTNQGTASRQTSHAYASGAYIEVDYSKSITYYTYDYSAHEYVPHVIVTNYSDFFKATTAGTSSSAATASITWAPGQGSLVTDGTVIWTNQGTKVLWSAIGTSYLVTTNITIADSNGNQQNVQNVGKSGAVEPTWSLTLNAITTDNTVRWQNLGAQTAANPLQWQYVYVFKSTLGDTGETYYHISPTSPISNAIFLASSSSIAVSGPGSDDTQVNFVDIYRTKQGGGVFYYVSSVANPGSSASTWSFVDTLSDDQLNTELIVTTVPINTPPPTGAAQVAWFQGRIWTAVGNKVYFDAGEDCINGDPHQSFPPANVFLYQSDVTALIPTSQGLIVGLADQFEVILGGPQTLTFYSQPLFQFTGIKSQNAAVSYQDNVYLLTSQGQGMSFSPSDVSEFGQNVGDIILSSFPPASSYITLHRSGPDVGVFLSDGSEDMLRFNPVTGAWSSLANPVGGCGPVTSLETSIGVFTLLTTIGSYICARNLTSFVDGHTSSTYQPFATIGSLDVAGMAGPTVAIRNLYTRTTESGNRPAVGILQNAISGTFQNIPFGCSVPAKLHGTAYQSTTVRQDRFDIDKAENIAMSEFNHLQVKFSWPAEDQKNELTGISIGDEAR